MKFTFSQSEGSDDSGPIVVGKRGFSPRMEWNDIALPQANPKGSAGGRWQKNVTHPVDSKLHVRIIEHCRRLAASEGIVLRPGMFFTVEPMINLGRPHVKVLSDGWTAVTRDRSLSAQFEHTIGVTQTGFESFTTSPKGLHKPPYQASTP